MIKTSETTLEQTTLDRIVEDLAKRIPGGRGMKQNNEIILYSTPDGDKKVGVLFHDENFWLTHKVLAELFNVKVPAVSKHLKNIFESGELIEDSVVSILETTAADGKNYKTKYYN